MTKPREGQRQHVIVLDTSFLIAYRQQQFWTLEAFCDLKRPETNIVIPQGVGGEYNRLMNCSSGYIDEKTAYGPIAELLGIDNLESYRGNLRAALSSKLDQCVDAWGNKHGTLSRTDKTVIQAVTAYAQHGDSVSLASSDWAIVAEVEKFELEDKLEVTKFSPWRQPRASEPLDLLVSGGVYNALSRIDSLEKSKRTYIAVMPNQHIGGGLRFDIAFEIYIQQIYGYQMPSIADGYYLRIFNNPMENPGLVWQEMVSSKRFFIRDPGLYAQIAFLINKNPISLQELRRRYAPQRNRYSRFKDPIPVKPDVEAGNLARIEEDDLGRHDKLTVGRLNEMRYKLNGRNGKH